ncbi:MAG TPA: SHOCT domain-containing protein, partial [Stellaceae bacterium]|nr:SHOCT domain-containing protein [Stellaceae bacterium]
YGEKASCACAHDVDYAKMSQFDVVDNVRREAEAQGFRLKKATFDKTAALGKELAFQGNAGKNASEAFLVGRSFYGRCRFTVIATGTSYADLLKAQHFIASVATKPSPAAPEATAAVYGVKVTNADADGAQPAPPAMPATPVDKADLAANDATAANAATESTPAAAAPSATTEPADKPAAAPAVENADAAPAEAEKANASPTPLTAATKPATDSTTAADSSAAANGSASAAAPAAPASAGGDEIAQRLRRLKLLFDQKLITREEFEAKREAILKTL